MSIMGKGGEEVKTRLLQRVFVEKYNPDKDNEEINRETVEDYWAVTELDESKNVLYEKTFDIDKYPEALEHFEFRSEYPVNIGDKNGYS